MATKKKKPTVSTDMKQVKKLLEAIPDDRKPIADSIYNELLFMQQTMTILKKQVQDEGAVDLFKQGAQEFLREHPALKAYNTTIQRYSLLYKQLIDLLPPMEEVKENDDLIDFINE